MFNNRTGETQPTSNNSDLLGPWLLEFLRAKKTEGISSNTLEFYQWQLGYFQEFAVSNQLDRISWITSATIRNYLLWLEIDEKHNPGGVHAAYRVLKTFLRWYEVETEPPGWRNPINRVKAPKLTEEPIEPVSLVDVDRMVKTCVTRSFLDIRDKALLLFLLDTGARAAEVLALDLVDVNQITGAVLIRQGKGGKTRTVFFENQARRAFRAYAKVRPGNSPAAWVADDGKRLHYGGLRAILARRANQAGIPAPGLHDFRRAFAINMLRNGCDLITLARLMGHTTLKVLQRYLYQLPDDLRAAHHKASPANRLQGKGTRQ